MNADSEGCIHSTSTDVPFCVSRGLLLSRCWTTENSKQCTYSAQVQREKRHDMK